MARWTGLGLNYLNLRCLGLFQSTGQWSRGPLVQKSNFVKPSPVVSRWIALGVRCSNPWVLGTYLSNGQWSRGHLVQNSNFV